MERNNTEITRQYYDKRFGNQSQRLNEEETIRKNAITEVLKKNFTDRQIRIADFGCGRGWLSDVLSAFGIVTGFDISEQAIANARRSFPGINFVCLDASAPLPAEHHGKFDLVVSSEVIEHLEDQVAYVKNLSKLLATGGHFIITTPNGSWFDAFYREGRESWKQPIENWRTREQLCEMLTEQHLMCAWSTSFNSEWVFTMRPRNVRVASHPLVRKMYKAFGAYNRKIRKLNRDNFGLNILVSGLKKE